MGFDEQVVGAVRAVAGPVALPAGGVGFVGEVTDPRHMPFGTQRFPAAAEQRAAPEVAPPELADELI
ncbi:hypothetical protein GCM10010294_17940 [Streptomyces griseoloalbus]|nr:hypothetical protein GCM10010294_17940 [Streptomyces griseoloalbus]